MCEDTYPTFVCTTTYIYVDTIHSIYGIYAVSANRTMLEHFKKIRMSRMPHDWTFFSVWPDTRALFTALRTWMSMSKGGFRVCKKTAVMSKHGNDAA